MSGGFGFTNGVEWLAAEQVNVHSARGLNWGADDNIVDELAQLNQLLSEHPCFFDGAQLKRLSEPDDDVFAFERVSAEKTNRVLVLANLNLEKPRSLRLPKNVCLSTEGLLIGSDSDLKIDSKKNAATLNAGTVVCFELETEEDESLSGKPYRDARARAAFAQAAIHKVGAVSLSNNWRGLAEAVNDPVSFLTQISGAEKENGYRPVVRWTELDQRRVALVPPQHWLLIQLPHRFRCHVRFSDGSVLNLESVPSADDWFAAVPPVQPVGDARIEVKLFGEIVEPLRGVIRYLKPEPLWSGCKAGEPVNHWAAERTVLLTNDRGGMTRINLDLGRVRSKYDCVLGANLHDCLPVDRHILVKRIRLWANADGFVVPLNAENLIWFGIDDSLPWSIAVWRFRVQAGNGRSTVVRVECFATTESNSVTFELIREQTVGTDTLPLRLTARVDLEDRNFHWETQRNEAAEHHFSSNLKIRKEGWGFEFQPSDDRFVTVVCGEGKYHHAPEWSENLPHPVEASRGQTGEGDGWSPGWFDIPLVNDGDAAVLVAQTEPGIEDDPEEMRRMEEMAKENSPNPLLKEIFSGKDRDFTAKLAGERSREKPTTVSFEKRLKRAASQFIVRRGDFKSVIAGYPWFLDWGRDTLICARGLIAGGWIEEVKQLLIVFGRFEENGTLPNTIHGADASNRDTSDAPLWYGVVAEELAATIDDSVYELKVDETRSVTDVLRSIATGYLNGTTNGIHVDADSGLVWSPSHFTWMDTNYPAGTPREGFPIEIQALWIRLLQLLGKLDSNSSENDWSGLAENALASIEGFYWLQEQGWYADSIVAESGQSAAAGTVDQALRSNCLIPISFGLLNRENARRCVEAARDYLVIPGGLRSLAPLPVEPPLPVYGNVGHLLNDPKNPYWGRYKGDEDTRRKPAYHNGTAWTWTFPTFCEALAAVHGESTESIAAAKAYLGSVDELMDEGCFGQIPEVLDGDAPHTQRGCDAQAWGVTETLRVWKKLNEIGESEPEK